MPLLLVFVIDGEEKIIEPSTVLPVIIGEIDFKLPKRGDCMDEFWKTLCECKGAMKDWCILNALKSRP